MTGAQVQRRLPTEPESLDVLQDLVAGLWTSEPSVGSTERLRFEMAVVEIFGNIVQHSRRTDVGPPVRTVQVGLTVDPEAIVATFADDGRPAAVDLSAVTMPQEDAESGRGLALAIAAVDDVSYLRDGDVNRWTVTCRRAG